jgi:hypothetical protein
MRQEKIEGTRGRYEEIEKIIRSVQPKRELNTLFETNENDQVKVQITFL